MSRHSRKQMESLFEFAGREITTVNLKLIFDNVRNYGLAALVLKGSKIAVASDGVGLLIGAPALFVSMLLIVVNVIQSYLIAYKYFSEAQKSRLGGTTEPLSSGFALWCGFLAIASGGSLVYVIFRAIPF